MPISKFTSNIGSSNAAASIVTRRHAATPRLPLCRLHVAVVSGRPAATRSPRARPQWRRPGCADGRPATGDASDDQRRTTEETFTKTEHQPSRPPCPLPGRPLTSAVAVSAGYTVECGGTTRSRRRL